MTGNYTEAVPNANAQVKGRSLWQDAWLRFKRNKRAMVGLVFILILIAIAVFTLVVDAVTAGEFYKTHIVKQDLINKLETPSTESLADIFGRDEFGRSIFYRVIWGTRYSLFVGAMVVVLSVLVGGFLGALAGFFGGWLDNVIMRVMDIFLAIPYTLFAIAIVSTLGPSMVNLFISIAFPAIPQYARITRASIMGVKGKEYVDAARAVGANDATIIFKYLVPNSLAPIIVQATLGIANAILNIAGLSFLGLGIQPPAPEWGSMLTTAKSYIRDAWHITVIPGLFIVLTTVAFNLFGDGLRDALDPKLKN